MAASRARRTSSRVSHRFQASGGVRVRAALTEVGAGGTARENRGRFFRSPRSRESMRFGGQAVACRCLHGRVSPRPQGARHGPAEPRRSVCAGGTRQLRRRCASTDYRYGLRWFGDFRRVVPGSRARSVSTCASGTRRAYRYRPAPAVQLRNKDGAGVGREAACWLCALGWPGEPRRQAAVALRPPPDGRWTRRARSARLCRPGRPAALRGYRPDCAPLPRPYRIETRLPCAHGRSSGEATVRVLSAEAAPPRRRAHDLGGRRRQGAPERADRRLWFRRDRAHADCGRRSTPGRDEGASAAGRGSSCRRRAPRRPMGSGWPRRARSDSRRPSPGVRSR